MIEQSRGKGEQMKNKPNQIDIITGEELRKARIKRKLSQTNIGKLAGITRQAISNYEAGIRALTIEELITICENAGIDTKRLINTIIKKSKEI